MTYLITEENIKNGRTYLHNVKVLRALPEQVQDEHDEEGWLDYLIENFKKPCQQRKFFIMLVVGRKQSMNVLGPKAYVVV